MAAATGDVFRLVRKGIDVRTVHANTRKPFRLYLCGEPALVAAARSFLLSGHDDSVPLDAAACLETIVPGTAAPTVLREARAVLHFSSTPAAQSDLEPFCALQLPVFAVTVDPHSPPAGPASAPRRGTVGAYTVPGLTKEAMRQRLFAHLVESCKGVEIAVGRRLPPLRESVAAKLTRDAASAALKVAIASAVVDHVPVVGFVLGAVASAGDTVAITGIQMMLLLHIEAAYGKDPDIHRMWQLLPVVGGGFGWRMLARELSGFIPVAGIPIKGAIAYAGTIVVGEGVTFFHEHGKHMAPGDARTIYESTKKDALHLAGDLGRRIFKR